jgi:ribosome-associated toxin RatA of RatAB toxin-antitoxin module
VADIDSYPRFLPWCRSIAVHERSEDRVRATLEIARGPLHHAFTTENRLVQDRSIEMRLVSGPFRHLHGCWRFDPVGERGARVSLEMDFDFSSRLLELTLGPVFTDVTRKLVDAFRNRAVQVYGKGRGTDPG